MPTYTTSWIGNSFSGATKFVQLSINAIAVASDGTVYTNSNYDEAGQQCGIYKDGDYVGRFEDASGKAIAIDSTYAYIAKIQDPYGETSGPPDGTRWFCVRRYNLSDRQPSGFTDGKGWDNSLLVPATGNLNDFANEITGLAVGNGKLYVSIKNQDLVKVYNLSTLAFISQFTVTKPWGIAVDSSGNAWVASRRSGNVAGKVSKYNASNVLQTSINGNNDPTQGKFSDPTSICIDSQNRLLIVDAGIRQQIFRYNIASTTPTSLGPIGLDYGLFNYGIINTSGRQRADALVLYGTTAAGVDALGNIYIACGSGIGSDNGSGTDLRKITDGTPRTQVWRLFGLHFLDMLEADTSDNCETVYGVHEIYKIDYTKPAGQQWSYFAFTLDPFKNPHDPRLQELRICSIFARTIQGKKILYMTGQYLGFLAIYRLNPSNPNPSGYDGYIAIPSGLLTTVAADGGKAFSGDYPANQPSSGEWIWRDKNNNRAFDSADFEVDNSGNAYAYMGGWNIDANGGVWRTIRTATNGLHYFPMGGFDTHGNPIYNYSTRQVVSHPSFFTDLRAVHYVPNTDTMYLTGMTTTNPGQNGAYEGTIGTELARINNYLNGGNRTATWRKVLPIDTQNAGEYLPPSSIAIEGDYAFVGTVRTKEVFVYQLSDGAQVAIMTPDSIVGGPSETGELDIPIAISAKKRNNNGVDQYVVFVEEDAKAKVLMYLFNP